MALKDELGLKTDFHSPAHEALLGLTLTAALIRKRADTFLQEHGLTDAQLNALLLLHYQSGEAGGLTQVELGRMMFVNRANVTALIDRLERGDFVRRTAVPGDRRLNLVELTPKGAKVAARAEADYSREVARIMGDLNASDQRTLVRLLERVRGRLHE